MLVLFSAIIVAAKIRPKASVLTIGGCKGIFCYHSPDSLNIT